MDTLKVLQNSLAEISSLRQEIATQEEDLKKEKEVLLAPLVDKEVALSNRKAEYFTLREEVLAQLQANKMEKYGDDKVTVYITKKNKFKVANPDKVIGWLKEQNLKVDDYFEMATARVVTLAESLLAENGELVDGVEHQVVETLNVRDK